MASRNYADWILDNQDRLGWGNEETARRARVSPTTISNLISGKISRPHYKTLRKLAGAFEVEVPEDPRRPALFSLAWARASSDGEFYRRVIEETDTAPLVRLRDEMREFVSRPLRRVIARRNDKPFEDEGPEPEPGERGPMEERLDVLVGVVKRLDPPFARVRLSDEGNECRWLVPPDEWEEHRERVDRFFEGEPYEDVDARGEVPAYEEPALYA